MSCLGGNAPNPTQSLYIGKSTAHDTRTSVTLAVYGAPPSKKDIPFIEVPLHCCHELHKDDRLLLDNKGALVHCTVLEPANLRLQRQVGTSIARPYRR